jgi:SAM-dependent methyltransferase
MNCRCCGSIEFESILDLRSAPLSNRFLSHEDLSRVEKYHPLNVILCKKCFFIQLNYDADFNEIFDEKYVYFSGVSDTWVRHTKKFSEDVVNQLSLTSNSFVVEIACNDGTLLKNFANIGVPCLGVEPTRSTADEAKKNGLEVLVDFFSFGLAGQIAAEWRFADLIVCNNVLAHVPDLSDFVRGLKYLLAPKGVISIEVPHVLNLLKNVQFDTVYHEHFSYFSYHSLFNVMDKNELRIIRIEEIDTHGGSIRAYVAHK